MTTSEPRGRGRPSIPPSERLSEQIWLRLTPAEAEALGATPAERNAAALAAVRLAAVRAMRRKS